MSSAPLTPVAKVQFLPIVPPKPGGPTTPPSPVQTIASIGGGVKYRGTLSNAVLKAAAYVGADPRHQARIVLSTPKAGVYQLANAFIVHNGGVSPFTLDAIGASARLTEARKDVLAITGSKMYASFDDARKGVLHSINELKPGKPSKP